MTLPSITEVWQALGGGELKRGRGRAFWRGGDGLNISINADKGAWYDFTAGTGGGILDLVATVLACDRPGAGQWIRDAFGIPERTLTPAERRAWRRQRARAEREAAALAAWRSWALLTLRHWRDHFWRRSRRAENWMRGAGLKLGFDNRHILDALTAVTDGERTADRMNEAVERLIQMNPSDVRRLRDAMFERKAAA